MRIKGVEKLPLLAMFAQSAVKRANKLPVPVQRQRGSLMVDIVSPTSADWLKPRKMPRRVEWHGRNPDGLHASKVALLWAAAICNQPLGTVAKRGLFNANVSPQSKSMSFASASRHCARKQPMFPAY